MIFPDFLLPIAVPSSLILWLGQARQPIPIPLLPAAWVIGYNTERMTKNNRG